MNELLNLQCGMVNPNYVKEFDLKEDFTETGIERWLIVTLTYHMDISAFSKEVVKISGSLTDITLTSVMTLVHVFIQINMQKIKDNTGYSLKEIIDMTDKPAISEFLDVVPFSPNMARLIHDIVNKFSLKTVKHFVFVCNTITTKIKNADNTYTSILTDMLNDLITFPAPVFTPGGKDEDDELMKTIATQVIVYETKLFYDKVIKDIDFMAMFKTIFAGSAATADVKDARVIHAIDFLHQYMNDPANVALNKYEFQEDVLEYFLIYENDPTDHGFPHD